jgi:hypothetical protein
MDPSTLIPTELLGVFSIVVKYLMDVLDNALPDAKPWAKQVAVLCLSEAFAWAFHANVLPAKIVAAPAIGVTVSGIILASFAAVIVHPVMNFVAASTTAKKAATEASNAQTAATVPCDPTKVQDKPAGQAQ